MTKKLIALILATATFYFSFAENIIVTSNADSGPGTLREAIIRAKDNGSSQQDTILFNIADLSASGRTITLRTALPPLSSNLVMDGTSQAGGAFGISDAKIVLNTPSKDSTEFIFFQFDNASNIEIYGLYIFNTYNNWLTLNWFSNIRGICFTSSKNITIGRPGKGNYFRGLRTAIESALTKIDQNYVLNSFDITVQSNVFNYNEAGEPTLDYSGNSGGYVNPMGFAVNLFNCTNITIGGNQPKEGNLINAEQVYIRSYVVKGNGFLNLFGNKIGVNHDGSIPTNSAPKTVITIQGDYMYGTGAETDYKVSIKGNILNGNIFLYKLSEFITVQDNELLHDDRNTNNNYTAKLVIGQCSGGGLVGGNGAGESNEFYSINTYSFPQSWMTGDWGSVAVYGSPKVSIQKNVMWCNHAYGSSITVLGTPTPYVQIDSTGINYVRGKATPNSTIEVFADDDCWACDGKVLLGTTKSAADSSWNFSGSFNGVIIATATKDGSTSEYSAPVYDIQNVKIQQPTCRQYNGSVTGIKLLGSWTDVEWHQYYYTSDGYYIDTVCSRSVDLENRPPGRYYFVSKLGETCHSYVSHFELKDYTPKIDTALLQITQPSCGKSNGAVDGLQIINGDYSKVVWESEQQNFPIEQSGYGYIRNLPEGGYRLIAKDTTAGCADTTRFYKLVNQSGPSLNTTSVQIHPANCGKANGSITGVSLNNAINPVFIKWVDSTGAAIAYSYDLVNVPPGKYRLQCKDAGGCDTLSTPFYTIPNKGNIVIDMAAISVMPSKCVFPCGSIQNLQVAGADAYQWVDEATGTVVSTDKDVDSLSPGTYKLMAANNFGCTLTSAPVTVPITSFIPIKVIDAAITDANCGTDNAAVRVNTLSGDANRYHFQWIDSVSAQDIGTAMALDNLGAGTYQLLAIDTNGCQSKIFSAVINAYGPPQIDYSHMQVQPDACNEKNGMIKDVQVNNLRQPAFYTWFDADSHIKGNQLVLQGVGAGTYTLKVSDAEGCSVVGSSVTITNNDMSLPPPAYDDVIIPRYSSATLTAKNLASVQYLLHARPGDPPLQENSNGSFTVNNITSDTSFYVTAIRGTCESSPAQVNIKVVDKSYFAIPTAFTPNGDGKNDVLHVKVIGYVQLTFFRIFNRYGELIYETHRLNDGWNGKYRGTMQPDGAFVWMAEGKDINGKRIAAKGSFVLIK